MTSEDIDSKSAGGLLTLVTRLERRVAELERAPSMPDTQRRTFQAVEGQFYPVEPGPEGLAIVLPKPRPQNRSKRITFNAKNGNPILLQALDGLVNNQRTLKSNAPGTFSAISDGETGWSVDQTITALGSGAAALGAQYVLGAADGSLPNGRVVTDSTEIDADLTTPNVISWALRTASVVFGKLQNLTGLSVLGRAANSSGVMAAITAGGGAQYLRSNSAGTSLEWGSPASTSVINNGGSLERAALTGAISAAQNSNATLFAGIRDNGTLETARGFLNFVSTAADTLFSITQDAVNDELEVRVSTLGSFYAQNSGATVQTKFISFDNGTGTTASVVNNTGTSGYINVSFSLASIAGLSVLGRSASSSGVPAAITASAARQVFRVNDAGTALEWGSVPSVKDSDGGLLFFNYTFDTSTTMADPGAGDVRFNNATPSSVTQIAIDDTDEDGISVGTGSFQSPFSWGRMVNSIITFRSSTTPTKYATYRATTGNDQTGYWDLTVTHIDSDGGAFTNGEAITVTWTPNGNNTFLAPVALDADMEAGTSLALVVPPGRQHRHPSAAKAWCEWNTTTTIFASYNVTSVTDTAAGTSTVVFDTDFSSTAYAPVVCGFHTSGTARTSMFASGAAAGSFIVNSFNSTGTLTDPTGWSCVVFGDQ